MTTWAAPHHPGPVTATVAVPGSKSITNRALVLAALADGPGVVTGALRSRDTNLMIGALRALGARVEDAVPAGDGTETATTLAVTPGPLRAGSVDCGLAGTVMRFVPPVAALAAGDVRFDGDPQARIRPMGVIIGALRDLGVEVDGDALPFTVRGAGRADGGEVTVDASGSSQFVSGLLLSAARYDKGVTVRHQGGPVPSMPHIEMTVDMLAAAGVTVRRPEPGVWTVEPGPIGAVDWVVEPDLSNATPFLAAAAVTGGTVTVPLWPTRTTQAGDAIREILARMGCAVELDDEGLTVTGPDALDGIDIDLRDVGELTPTVAAVAALASSPSALRGIAHLRGHETDRLAALTAEITGLGGMCEETDDGLRITPAPLRGGLWHSYADHRMATAGAIVGLKVEGVSVEDIETTSKTLPGFAGMWSAMLDPVRQ